MIRLHVLNSLLSKGVKFLAGSGSNNSQVIKNGFTLIELLVVFTVTAILAGIGVASFVTYSRSEQISQNAANVKQLISQAKFNSLSVVKTSTNDQGVRISCGSQSLVGYSVDFVKPDKVILTQVCDEIDPPDKTIRTLKLSAGISISDVTAPQTNCSKIIFGSLDTNVSGVPCAIKLTGLGNNTKVVGVDLQGNATIE